ncbi:UNVERIFIED_ORG: hypothetical protein GGI57_005094 [Rhizobium aethiopicum]|uniref:hypothetical protein n=1 Tax=Rhizobium TaxID=379 RepID=UPI00067346D1|nr:MULTISPECIES: hypothetical protein [Rhizobium]OHV23920.1 hypothetical protein BBJ66_26665 [Rhizobium sp. RSm-3]RVU06710.1 hypothetical protein EOS93_27685 [Rhizobium sp. RMa-01]
MRLSALVRSAAAVALLFALTSTDVTAKGGTHHRSCAELQAMMDHGLTGGKHAGDSFKRRAKVEQKMKQKGC